MAPQLAPYSKGRVGTRQDGMPMVAEKMPGKPDYRGPSETNRDGFHHVSRPVP